MVICESSKATRLIPIQTIGSCDGQRLIVGATPPYVHFRCSEDVALRLVDALAEDGDRTALNHDGGRCGNIAAKARAELSSHVYTRRFSRQKVERDIVLVSGLISR